MRTLGWIILILIVIGLGFLVFGYRSSDSTDASNTASTTTANGSDNGSTDTSNTPSDTDTSNNSNSGSNTSTSADIVVTSPKVGDKIASPITVSGKARGSWFFEASAPVKVTDASGKVLGTGHIQAQGEWMTTDYVPFTGTVSFAIATSSATSTSGFVVFENDNPSGDPARAKSLSIPVKFR